MRVIIPEYISQLASIIRPYIEWDKSVNGFKLRDDAPEEVKAAKKICDEWDDKNLRPVEFPSLVLIDGERVVYRGTAEQSELPQDRE